jgi:hypothetical protein
MLASLLAILTVSAGPPKGDLVLECVVSTRYEGYPENFRTPDETIRLKVDRTARTLSYWDEAALTYVTSSERASKDWSRAFRFGAPAASETTIALDGSTYRNLTDSSDGRAETSGSCRAKR